MKNLLSILLTITLMNVFIPDVRCEIGNLPALSAVNNIEISSATDQLTDVAMIDLPKNIMVKKGQTLTTLTSQIKKGDSVKISGGYRGYPTKTEFHGFVSRISKNVPLRIECEDYMYLLKLDAHTFSLKNPTLKDIVDQCLTGDNIDRYRADGFDFNVEVSDTEPLYDSFTSRSQTGSQLLHKITNELPFAAYFIHDAKGVNKPTLVVGYRPGKDGIDTTQKPVLRFSENVPEAGWQLEYQTPEDTLVKVRAISNLKSGKKIIVELGDPSGEMRTLNYAPMSKEQLTIIATEEMKYLKRDGFKGNVTAFGLPYIRHGDVVIIHDPVYVKESGSYFVDGTVWKFNHSPYIRREIRLGLRAV